MSDFPYDEAIRQLTNLCDEAKREATAWGYYAINEAYKGKRFVKYCRNQQRVQRYLEKVFDAALKHTEKRKLEAAMERVVGEAERNPLVEAGYTSPPSMEVAEVAAEI